MRFGKAVLAEAFDLRKKPFGELAGDAALDETFDELVFVAQKLGAAFPGRHIAPKLVGLSSRVTSSRHRDLHHLFLKERHSERALEDRRERWVRHGGGFLAVTAAQIRVNHAPLNRPRANNGYLDDEIVEAARFHARQHGHLRAALDLENANRVGLTNGVIDT